MTCAALDHANDPSEYSDKNLISSSGLTSCPRDVKQAARLRKIDNQKIDNHLLILKRIFIFSLFGLALAHLAACAGGGGGERDNGDPAPAAAPVPDVNMMILPPPSPPETTANRLMIESPEVNKDMLRTGEKFILSATIKKEDMAYPKEAVLHYRYSQDSTITAADVEIGTYALQSLPPVDGNPVINIHLIAPESPGTYYYGACISPGESNESDHCSSGVRVIVSSAPVFDLIIESPEASDKVPEAGQIFTLSATIKNQGTDSSPETALRYYRSHDSTITSADAEIGTDSVPALSADGISEQNIEITAPAEEGIYYYGACVVSIADESDEDNNCSGSLRVAVSLPPAPDLIIESLGTSKDALTTKQAFTLSATIKNQGTDSSHETVLRYYRSHDSTITGADAEIGTDSVPALSADGISEQNIELTAPAEEGIYYYGACVVSVVDESDEGNNCSGSVRVAVSLPPAPDLIIESLGTSEGALTTKQAFTLSATIKNQGTGSSPETALRYYRSNDSTITGADAEIGTDSVPALSADGTSEQNIGLTAPAEEGIYYYGACVVSIADESDEGNNCSGSVRVAVSPPPVPDLIIESLGTSKDTLTTKQAFTLSATIKNQGTGSSPETALRYYRSHDSTITSADAEIGTDSVPALSADGTSEQNVELTAPESGGIYYYGACVVSVSGESDAGNNCSGSVRVNVSTPPPSDLIVESINVRNTSIRPGQTFTLFVSIRNQGIGHSSATSLRYYSSRDSTITATDAEIGSDPVPSISTGFLNTQNIALTAPAEEGIYYYGACVVSVAGESNKGNNCSLSVRVNVSTSP